jgi:uncharacterized protein (TIGR04255 family)
MIFDLEKIRLPRKINPDLIEEAVVEIRFESEIPPQEVVDQLLVEFGRDYTIRKELPASQIPPIMRDQDPQFRYLPIRQLIKDEIVLQIGGRVISCVNKKPYLGWKNLKDKVENMAEKLKASKVVGEYKRLGIRYLNIFDTNVLDKVNLVFSASGSHIVDEKIDLRLSLDLNRFQAAVKVSNNVRAVINDRVIDGSLVDIDAFIVDFREDELMTLIEEGHSLEKKLFFALLKDSFVKGHLNPEYS